MRKSLLPTKATSSATSNSNASGRCTDFVALIDHADLADTSQITFAEHVNREGLHVFELNNPIKSNVRHIGTEDTEDGESDYCVAFFNRRTKETEYKPISFLRVAPKNKRKLEESGLLEGKSRRVTTNYNLNTTLTTEEYKEKRNELTMDFGNARKRKTLEATARRKIDTDSINVMNNSMLNQTLASDSSFMDGPLANSTLNGTKIEDKNFSLMETPTSMVLPKMNMQAKSPDDVFKLEDFFEADELEDYKIMAKTFFNTYSTVDKLCEYGVPKFIAQRVLEAHRRTDLCASGALKLALLSIVVPRGRSLTTNVNLMRMENVTPRVKMWIEGHFVIGKQNKKQEFILQKDYKDKILSHMFALYFTLTGQANYTLPLGYISTELQIADTAAKTLLQKIGCMIQEATPEEKRTLNTTQMARLVGPLRTMIKGRGRVNKRR